jgi:hypothetical protein
MNNDRYRFQQRRTHDEALEHLLHRPRLLGINEPVVWSAKQLLIYKETYPDLLTDIDLLYRTPGDIWIAEYKVSPGYLKDAKRQLVLGREFVKEHFSTTPRCLYVTGAQFDRFEL